MVVSIDNIAGFIIAIIYAILVYRAYYTTKPRTFYFHISALLVILTAAFIWGFPILVGIIGLGLVTIFLYKGTPEEEDGHAPNMKP